MQFILDRVLSVAGTYANANSKKGIEAGQLALMLDQITEPSLSFTSETEDIVDARNNVVAVLENGRGCTFGAANAFFNTELLAQQTGGVIEAVTAETFTKYSIVTPDASGKVNFNDLGAPLAASAYTYATDKTTKTGFAGKVYKLAGDNSLKEANAVSVTYVPYVAATTGENATPEVKEGFTVTGLVAGEKLLVVYDASVAGDKVTAIADASNELLNVTAEVLLKELCNESLYYAYIIMKGKLSGEAEWAMQRDGNHSFELRCFPEYCGDKKLVDIIIVKGE